MKKNALYVFLALPMLWLSGCSDYASEGVFDTRIIREQADIEEITGSVYGLKEGAQEAIANLSADRTAIRNIDDEIWDAVKAQKSESEYPTLTLKYDGADGKRLLSAYDALVDAAEAKFEQEKSEYDAEVAELETELAKYQATLTELDKAQKEHDAYTAKYEKKYKAAQAKLEKGKESYNAVFASAIKEVAEAAETHGINGRYSDSLIGRYRSIDYSKRSANPETCPTQRGYFAVDARDINNICAYLTVPRNIQGTPAEASVKAIMTEKFKEFLKAGEVLGKKRSWGNEATGLFAEVDKAERDLKDSRGTADRNYGDARSRNYKMRNAKQYIARINDNLERIKSEEYVQNYVYSTFLSEPDVFNEAYIAYRDAMEEHFAANFIEKTSDIKMAEVDGVTVGSFEDVDSGYTHLIGLADILANGRGGKQVIRSIDLLSTEAPEVAEADELTFAVTRDNADPRGRDISEEKKVDEVIDMLLKTMKS